MKSVLESLGFKEEQPQLYMHRGSARDVTLLMETSAYGHERLVEMLLERGAALDLQNDIGAAAR